MTTPAPGPGLPAWPAALLVVALGGAVGASLRWGLGQLVPVVDGHFPWTTFAINVTGSALLALLPAWPLVRRSALLPPALGTGVLGGYTTLSAYAEESRALLGGGHTGLALTYLVGTLAACLLAVAMADHVSTLARRAEVEAAGGDL